ncbi:MAG: polysaccharide biosynthesis/export family protein [Planctomycetota bacterium]
MVAEYENCKYKTHTVENRPLYGRFVVLCSVLSISVFGCGDKFWDPTQIGRFRPMPAVNVILGSLGVADETPSAWEGAEEPRPIDMMVLETDYAFSPGDIVRITIFELLREADLFVRDFVVTETGKISIPEVGLIQVEGLTESQLEEELRQILEPGILKEPAVTVILLSSQKRTYSISGQGVPVPGRYSIPRYDFRLLDALATAGGISQFNISYVFVSRSVTGGEERLLPLEPEGAQPERPTEGLTVPERKMLETIAPWAGRQLPANKLVISSAEMATNGELAAVAVPEGFKRPTSYSVPRPAGEESVAGTSGERLGSQKTGKSVNEEKKARIEWVFQDGRWVPVQVGGPVPTEPVRPEFERVVEPLREEMPAPES